MAIRNGKYTINFDGDDFAEQAVEQPTTEPEAVIGHSGSGLHFASFGSGSSGNCSFIGNERAGIIVDAGIDPDYVFENLKRNGIDPARIAGVLLTHDHSDHVRYAYKIMRAYKHMQIYCTPKLLNALLRNHNLSRRIKDYHHPIFKEIPFKVAGMQVTAFDTSHDAGDNMGFFIETSGGNFVVATDMGVITERAEYYMRQAHYLMIESNYDRHMLDTGRYPEFLKARVRGERGHLDNDVAAEFVATRCHCAKYVFLCHLSNDNNTPEIALDKMRRALEGAGLTVGDAGNAIDQRDRDIQLYALPRHEMSTWFPL